MNDIDLAIRLSVFMLFAIGAGALSGWSGSALYDGRKKMFALRLGGGLLLGWCGFMFVILAPRLT